MKEPTLEWTLINVYKATLRDLLLSHFKDDIRISTSFLSDSVERQRKIEGEIDRKAEEIAVNLVSNLKSEGYLERPPTDVILRALILQSLKESGIDK